jgi:hypothetical protein
MLFFIYLSVLELFAHLEPQGKIWKLFSRGSHHKPKKNNGNSVFKKKDIGIIFQRFPSQAKNKKNTEIPFSNRIYWHYFPEAPITSPKSYRNSVFKKKILALFSKGSHHKPKKTTEIPFSHEVLITSQKSHGNSVFK